jgi:hypothetical protein
MTLTYNSSAMKPTESMRIYNLIFFYYIFYFSDDISSCRMTLILADLLTINIYIQNKTNNLRYYVVLNIPNYILIFFNIYILICCYLYYWKKLYLQP